MIEYWQRPVRHLDEFSQLLHVDTRTMLADDLLFYGDKLSMANSVEARVPLLDRELVSFVETLPPSFKLRRRTTKFVHKRAAERLLPVEVTRRPKMGFETPVNTWFARELAPAIERSVLGPDSFCTEHLDEGFVRGLLDDHVAGRRNNRRQLATLLSLEMVSNQLFGTTRSLRG